MTNDYETLRDCRPRVKQDVIYAKTPNGVIFHNASTGFQISSRSAYEFAAKIVPHLNGSNRVADIYELLPEQHRPLLVSMVRSLIDRGFVRDLEDDAVVPDGLDDALARQFAAQINYIDHYEGAAKQRFMRLRNTPVAVLGSDHTARWAVLGLIRNGVAHVGVDPELDLGGARSSSIAAELAQLRDAGTPADVEPLGAGLLGWANLDGYRYVVVAGERAGVQVRTLLAEGIPGGVHLLSALTVGRRAVVGPLMSADAPGCTMCALLRLGQNGDPADGARLADVWAQLAVGAPRPSGPPTSRSLAGMLGNLLGYDVFRSASGAMPAETGGAVVLQDLESTDVSTEPLLPHPRCTRCAPLVGDGEPLGALDPQTEPRIEPDEVDRSEPQFEIAGRYLPLFGANAGVLGGYADADAAQLPVRVGSVTLGLDHATRRTITAFDVHTTIAARIAAIRAAAVTYALSLDGHGTFFAATGPAVDVGQLSLAAVRVGASVSRWAGGAGLLTGAPVRVPAAAVWNLGALNADGLVLRSRTGVAAHDTVALAAGTATLSALGIDAVLAAAAGGPSRTVDLATVEDDAQLGYLTSCAANLDVPVELIELPAMAPVLLARAVDPRTGRTHWTFASDVSWRAAATTALCDLIGSVQVGRDGADPDRGAPLLDAFDPHTVLAGPTTPADLDRAVTWEDIRAGLRDGGRDVALVDIGSADLARGGLRVVRAVLFDARTEGASR